MSRDVLISFGNRAMGLICVFLLILVYFARVRFTLCASIGQSPADNLLANIAKCVFSRQGSLLMYMLNRSAISVRGSTLVSLTWYGVVQPNPRAVSYRGLVYLEWRRLRKIGRVGRVSGLQTKTDNGGGEESSVPSSSASA